MAPKTSSLQRLEINAAAVSGDAKNQGEEEDSYEEERHTPSAPSTYQEALVGFQHDETIRVFLMK